MATVSMNMCLYINQLLLDMTFETDGQKDRNLIVLGKHSGYGILSMDMCLHINQLLLDMTFETDGQKDRNLIVLGKHSGYGILSMDMCLYINQLLPDMGFEAGSLFSRPEGQKAHPIGSTKWFWTYTEWKT